MAKFSSNPIMFRIQNINRDTIDSTIGASAIVGSAFHKAMEVYYGGSDQILVANEAEAIEGGLKAGMEYIELYNDGWIKWSESIPNKQKAQEVFAFAFSSYVTERPYNVAEILSIEEKMLAQVNIEWRGKSLDMPVPLKGYLDKLTRRPDGKLVIVDYKTASTKTNKDKIDGRKIIQAVIYYLLVYAKYGEEPHSMVFEVVKTSKNRDNSPQVESFEFVYTENELFFQFFFRLYQDMTRAINGEMVWVPNIDTFFDNEISLIAYIHRLDMPDEQARLMKQHQVDNITDLLKKELAKGSNMRAFAKLAEKAFISAKNMNYAAMTSDQKIQTKLMEHGMLVQFDSKVEGSAFDLYRYMPSIGLKMSKLEAYVADIEQVLGVTGVRVLAPIQHSTLVGFEVPRAVRTFPQVKIEQDGYNLAIGVDLMGDLYRYDITQAPHMLVAGATGSGKSVFLNSIIEQLTTLPNTEIQLFDPKIVELMRWEGSPNVIEYQSDHEYIKSSLSMLVDTMNQRYRKMAEKKVRDVGQLFPQRFVIIDEFGDLSDKESQESIRLVAQKARACGIHLIIATQRPSVDIISGTIKSNFPVKVAFRMSKAVDSQVLMDEKGAEKLLGKGDMLFSHAGGIIRLQGLL